MKNLMYTLQKSSFFFDTLWTCKTHYNSHVVTIKKKFQRQKKKIYDDFFDGFW